MSRAVASRQAAPLAAVQDMLSRTDIGRPEQAESLRANLEGAGPDDAKAIRRLPKQETHMVRSETKAVANPDEALAAGGRTGACPDQNLQARRLYGSQKYLLQLELLFREPRTSAPPLLRAQGSPAQTVQTEPD